MQINVDVATFNELTGRIVANGCDSLITLTGQELDNFGLVRATSGGTVKLVGADIINQAANNTVSPAIPGGKIEAQDWGRIEIQGGSVSNLSGAVIKASDHGGVFFEGTHTNSLEVTNFAGGKIVAVDCGLVAFDDVTVVNDAHATIEAKNHGIVSFFETKHSNAGITNLGTIEAVDHGIVAFVDVGGDHNNGVDQYRRHDRSDRLRRHGRSRAVDHRRRHAADARRRQDRSRLWLERLLDVTINGGIVQVDCHAVLALNGDTVIDKTVTFEGPGVFVTKAPDSITGGDAQRWSRTTAPLTASARSAAMG